jgi:hypothetical protein
LPRHHSAAIRSPAAARTRCATPRQRNRTGGSSGTGNHLDLPAAQQADRPRRGGIADPRRLPDRQRRHTLHRAFRHMTLIRRDAGHAVGAQAVAQRIDHAGETIAGILRGDIGQPGLRCLQRRHDLGLQRDHLDAEARIDGVQLLAQQLAQVAGVAHRQRGAHRDLRHDAIDTEEPGGEALAAFVLLRQPQAQPFGKPREGTCEVLRRTDRFDERQTFMPFDRRTRPIDGFLHLAECLIQPQHRQGAEASSDLRAWNTQQVPHRAQAEPAQSGHRAGIEPQAGDGQIGQGRLFLP